MEFWCSQVQGLFVCGTYGSGPLLTAESLSVRGVKDSSFDVLYYSEIAIFWPAAALSRRLSSRRRSGDYGISSRRVSGDAGLGS